MLTLLMFRHPALLAVLALVGAALALFLRWSAGRARRALAGFGEPETLSRLFPEETAARRRILTALRVSAVALFLIALAGPQWGVELVEVQTAGGPVVLVVDTSFSMAAEDVQPSRMERAKAALAYLLESLKEVRVGIVAFAGEAHIHCPVTHDLEAAKTFLKAVRVGLVPQPGSSVGSAVRLATRMVSGYPGPKAVVLLTDGEDHKTDPLGAAAEARSQDVRIYAIGIGKPEGDPIPLKDPSGQVTGYKKDKRGETVVSRLGEGTLAEMAAATSGAYFRSSSSQAEVDEIAAQIRGLARGEGPGRGRTGSRQLYKDRYQIPLAAALFLMLAELLLPETRRRSGVRTAARAGAAALLVLFAAAPSQALGARGELRKGNKRYSAGEFDKALNHYDKASRAKPGDPRTHFNRGDAFFKLEKHDEAKAAFADTLKTILPPAPAPGKGDVSKVDRDFASKAYYNLGNTLYRQGSFKEAAESFKRSILLEPRNENAKYNLARALEKLEQKPPSKSQDKKDPKDHPQDQKDQKQDQDQGSGKKPPAPDRSRQMSREDAERILQAAKEREKEAFKPELLKPGLGQPKPPDVEEDW